MNEMQEVSPTDGSLKDLDRGLHILCGNRKTIVPSCSRVQAKGNAESIFGHPNPVCHLPIESAHLVTGSGDQLVIDVSQTRRCDEEVSDGRKGVEIGLGRHDQGATFRGIRLYIVEMREVGWILQFVEERNAMPVIALI